MLLILDKINILILMVAIINLLVGVLIFRRNSNNLTNTFFVLSIAGITVWNLSMVFFRSATDPQVAELIAHVLYAGAASIPFTFIFFVTVFPRKSYALPLKAWITLSGFFLSALCIALYPNLLVESVNLDAAEPSIRFNQFWHSIYALYIVGFFLVGFYVLLKKLQKSEGVIRKQLVYVFAGIFIASGVGVATNLIMPYLGNFSFNWAGQVATVFMVSPIAYAMLKHQLFEVKVITTEVLVTILIGILFTKILFSSSSTDTFLNVFIFLVVLGFSILLVRSIVKDVQMRSTIETLVNQLNTANMHLIKLDQQKSEFISIASHQLRTPLTAIKGYTSMLLEGSFGNIPKKSVEPLTTIFQSSQKLVKTVQNFLTLSRIEQGRMQYQFEKVELKKMVNELIKETKPLLEGRPIKMKFSRDAKRNYEIRADFNKLQHAIRNIMDNAVQHTNKGLIEVSLLYTINNNIRLTISDTGEGATRNELLHLFDKYTDAVNVSQQNGYDLYVAQEIIDGLDGAIRAESDGAGQGMTFFIEFRPFGHKPYVA